MADKYFGVGTVSTVASGDMTPANPASLAVDDILICAMAQHDNVVATMPAGWTRIVAQNNTANLRIDSFWRRVTNTAESGASVTVTHAAGNACVAQIMAFRGVVTTGNPYDASTSSATAANSTCQIPTLTPVSAGQTIVFIYGIDDDGAYAAVSGTDPVPTERVDTLTALGLDASLGASTGERSVATETGARTVANARANDQAAIVIALTNPSAGSRPPGQLPTMGIG